MKRTYITHYIVLIAILAIGAWTFFAVSPNKQLQLFTGIALSASYAVWGIVHHWAKREHHAKVVIEYVLIGAIAVVLLLTLLG